MLGMQSSLLSAAICRSCQNTPPSNYARSVFHLLYDKPIICLIPLFGWFNKQLFKVAGLNKHSTQHTSCNYPSFQERMSITDNRHIPLPTAGRSGGAIVVDFCCKATVLPSAPEKVFAVNDESANLLIFNLLHFGMDHF